MWRFEHQLSSQRTQSLPALHQGSQTLTVYSSRANDKEAMIEKEGATAFLRGFASHKRKEVLNQNDSQPHMRCDVGPDLVSC